MQASVPQVSAIIPYYNGDAYIRQAVESILDQTYSQFEIIVVDDGSDADSARIVQDLAADTRLKLIVHDTNRGIAAARNTGLREASGRYITFLDQDDTWHPQKLEKQIEALEKSDSSEIGFVFSDLEIINELGRKTRRRISQAPPGIESAVRFDRIKSFFLDNYIPIVTAMIRGDCFDEVGGFDEDIRSGADDYDLFFRLLMKYRFVQIPEPLATRRLHKANYSSIEILVPDIMMVLGRVLEQVPELGPYRRRRLGTLYDSLGDASLSKGDSKQAREFYQRSMKLGQQQIKTILGYLLASSGKAGRWLARNWLQFRMKG
jgi:glycosyltransferase involved in cell wall biosynthesis